MPNPPDLLSLLYLSPSARTPILQEALKAYPSYISEKLQPLDENRYETIPALLKSQSYLQKDDLLKLVDWKLSHGKFRPSLRKLVDSNSPETITETTGRAISLLHSKPEDVKAPLNILCELKGIGPATASLVLSCADPEGTVFFGDEVMEWVRPRPGETLKYSVKEYLELWGEVREVKGELGLTATEIEKAGFVFGKRLVEYGSDKVMVVVDVEGGREKGKEGKESIAGDGRGEALKVSSSGKRKAGDGEVDLQFQGPASGPASKKKAKVEKIMPDDARRSTRSKRS